MKSKLNKSSFLAILLFLSLITSCDTVTYKQGQVLYNAKCATCHMADGSGVSKLYPALNALSNSDVDIHNLACIIRYGQNKEKYSLEMAGIKDLTDIEINNIINYILNELNDYKEEHSIDSTKQQLANCISIK